MTRPLSEQKLVPIGEYAERLGVPKSRVLRWHREGRLDLVRYGVRWFIASGARPRKLTAKRLEQAAERRVKRARGLRPRAA